MRMIKRLSVLLFALFTRNSVTTFAQPVTTDFSYLNLPLKTITGQAVKLSDWKGSVLLLVNVASECGYTPQYEGLQKLYETYKDSGLVVIGFPANNFGEQEPGTNEQILSFCKRNYGVTFPMMAKISVKGEDIHPLYARLTSTLDPPELAWNFEKFLIDRRGNIAAHFGRKITPEDPLLVGKIEDLLKENPKAEMQKAK